MDRKGSSGYRKRVQFKTSIGRFRLRGPTAVPCARCGDGTEGLSVTITYITSEDQGSMILRARLSAQCDACASKARDKEP